MRSSTVLVFLAAVLVGFASADDFYNGLELKASRTIDLTTFVATHSVSITVTNTGDKPASHFFYTLPASQQQQVAGFHADANGNALKVTSVSSITFPTKPSQPVATYRVDLGKSLKKDESETVIVTLELLHQIQPHPQKILLNDRQYVRYFDSHYLLSPYNVKHQRTTVKLPSSNIEGKSDLAPTSVKGDSVVYGPYDNVAAFSVSQLFVHYENSKPFITVTRLNRDIEVSHWGNVAFEDDLDMQHDGAQLKVPFSRFDYQRPGSGPSSVKVLKQVLPIGAYDIYYRDEIGNISTSTLFETERGLEFEFQPRFPLFGGWKTSHYMGYNVDSSLVLSTLYSDGSHYVLNVSLAEMFDDVVIDHLTVKVILPEGSTNIDIRAPFPISGEKRSAHYTYLDTSGRPVAIFEVDRVVPNSLQFFQVHYHFSKVALLREPLILVLAFFLLFLTLLLLSRLQTALNPPKEMPAVPAKVVATLTKLKDLLKTRSNQYSVLQDALKKYLEDKTALSAYNGERRNIETNLQTNLAGLNRVLAELEETPGVWVAKVRDLIAREATKFAKQMQKVQAEEKYKVKQLTQAAFEETKTTLDKELADLQDEIDTLRGDISEFM